MSIFNYKQRNNITLISIILLGCLLFYALTDLFSSILGAIVLYTIFRPVYIYMVERRKWNKPLSAMLLIIASIIIVVIPFLTLSFMMIDKISSLNRHTFPIDEWLGKLDSGNVKVKVALSIVMISAIHLLRAFMTDTESKQLMLLAGVHLVFVVSALLLLVLLIFRYNGKHSN